MNKCMNRYGRNFAILSIIFTLIFLLVGCDLINPSEENEPINDNVSPVILAHDFKQFITIVVA